VEICKLRCFCGDTTEYQNSTPGSYRPSHVTEVTGWRYLFKVDGGTIWLCPTCSRLAYGVAHVLMRLLGTGLVRLDHVGELE